MFKMLYICVCIFKLNYPNECKLITLALFPTAIYSNFKARKQNLYVMVYTFIGK